MSQLTPTSDSKPPNRLSIGHLLLWTAATAVVLAAIMPERPYPDVPEEFPEELRQQFVWRQHALRLAVVAVAPILGAGLSGIAIAACRATRRRPGFPAAPGHWLLMVLGAVALAGLFARFHDFTEQWPGPWTEAMVMVLWLMALSPLVMLLVAMAKVREPTRWHRVFVFAGCNVALYAVFACLAFPVFPAPWVSWLFALALVMATPLSVVVAAVRDWQLGARYDVFHWAGVSAVPPLAAIMFVLMVCL
jgi:hypothetical protein